MSKELTEYEIEKQKKKQLQVRNEFLYYNQSLGKYDFPIIHKQDIDVEKIEFLSYVNTKNNDIENKHKIIHFFTYDWLFENVYKNPEKEIEKLSQYYCLLSPDFSMWTNMPVALQIANCFKNRWCGAYWQKLGLKVIPTVSWSDEKSFDWCFDGIEEGSIVAVCTYYRENCEADFIKGYNKMLEKIKPSLVICYDEPFKSMKGNIKEFLPTTYEWTKKLSPLEQARFKCEKQLRNVSGLNPNDFKYIKYDDPFVKDQIVKCSICGDVALQDQFGNGECPHCGWKFSKDEKELEEKLGVSYPMLVTPTTAKQQYKKGEPFKATFEEFVNGLYFYSEMLFEYNNEKYEVFLKGKEHKIIFCCEHFQQEYNTREEFIDKANINGVLLKNMWDKIEKPSFMYCG